MRAAGPRRVRMLVWLVLAALVVLLHPRPAAARPVIPPERENEIQALLLPHRLGDEVATGWRLQSIAIELATIRVRVVGPNAIHGELTLDHPDYAPPGSRPSKSFALTVTEQGSGSEAAIAAVIEALERNDDGGFWAVHGAVAVDGEPDARFASGPLAWATDGILLFVLLLAITVALLVQALRQAPRFIAWALLAVFVLGALLRLGLTQEATLEPWSYTRFMIVARTIYEGPSLALVHPEPVFMTDVITTTVLVYAVLAPLTVFAMARYLLASDRAALVCAGLVAVLPLHIRFSHGDVSSIPSLTIAAAMFAMAQAAAREPDRRWLFAMLILLPVPMVATLLLRPPNILYAPLLLAMLLVHGGVSIDRPPIATRRLVAIAAVVGALTLGFGVPHVLTNFGQQVREGLSVATLGSAVEVLLSFEYNTLLNPRFTPPGLSLLALLGAGDLVRRKRWRLVACLGGWLLASLVTHAYVVPKSPFMQARYHLHLVLPFVCLAACGVEALLERVREHRHARPIMLVVFGYLAASPAIHLRFIRDVDFDDQREWAFVHRLRDAIPAGCTIVETSGEGAGARFARVGAHVVDGMPKNLWTIVELPADELLRDPPECVYAYEGLPCFAPSNACAAIHEHAALEEIDRLELSSRPYDENLARGLDEGDPVALRLFRIHAPE